MSTTSVLRLGLILFLMAVLLAPTVTFADGWPQRKGKGYYRIGLSALRATQYYEPGGNKIDIPTLSDYVVSVYVEHGLTDKLTVTGYVPFVERITLNRQEGRSSGVIFFDGDAVTNIADAEIGVRYGLLQRGGTVLSAALKFGVPIGQNDQENGLLTGDGELNQQIGLEAGHSFWPRPAYATVSAAFNNRVNGFSDEIVYKVEAGYTFAEVVTVSARVRGVASLENGDDGIGGSSTGLYANNQRYLAYGAEVAYTTRKGYGVALGADAATLAQSVLAAPAFTFGVFLKR